VSSEGRASVPAARRRRAAPGERRAAARRRDGSSPRPVRAVAAAARRFPSGRAAVAALWKDRPLRPDPPSLGGPPSPLRQRAWLRDLGADADHRHRRPLLPWRRHRAAVERARPRGERPLRLQLLRLLRARQLKLPGHA